MQIYHLSEARVTSQIEKLDNLCRGGGWKGERSRMESGYQCVGVKKKRDRRVITTFTYVI